MNVFKGKGWRYVSAGIYIFLTFLSFYCACYRLPVGLKYAINLVIAGWAVLTFLIRPQFNKAIFVIRFLVLFFLPYLIFWLWSVAIWTLQMQSLSFIVRGSQNVFYMLTNLLYTCAAVYLFDKRVMLYTFIGMALANFLCFLQVGMANGMPTLLQEYFRLLITFADDTGGVVRQLELHDMVYGWGAMVVYYAIHSEKKWSTQIICLLISSFFFTLGFKRIAIPAVAGAVVLFYLLRHRKEKTLRRLAMILAIVITILMLGYLSIIKSGLLFQLADEYGVDLMSRDVIFSYYQNFYEISPSYMGQGIRFIYAYGTEHSADAVYVDAVHNVYLETYIETGFWCWCFWIIFELSFRVRRVIDRYSAVPGVALMTMNFYVFFTFLTDNTSFYYPINVVYRMAVMVWCYEKMEQEGVRHHSVMSAGKLRTLRQDREFFQKQAGWQL